VFLELVDKLAALADFAVGGECGLDVAHGEHGLAEAVHEVGVLQVLEHELASGLVVVEILVGRHEAVAAGEVLVVLRVELVNGFAVNDERGLGGHRGTLFLQLLEQVLGHGWIDGGEDPVSQLHAVRHSQRVRTCQCVKKTRKFTSIRSRP